MYTITLWGQGSGERKVCMQLIIGMIIRTVHVWMWVHN